MKKPSIHTKLKVSVAFVWIGAVIALLSQYSEKWLLWVGLVIVAAAAVYRFTQIRCPQCGQPVLDVKTNPGKCPHCGEALE